MTSARTDTGSWPTVVTLPWCFWFWPHWAHPTLSPWFARPGVEKAEASTATEVSAIRRRNARRIGTAPLRKPASITAQGNAMPSVHVPQLRASARLPPPIHSRRAPAGGLAGAKALSRVLCRGCCQLVQRCGLIRLVLVVASRCGGGGQSSAEAGDCDRTPGLVDMSLEGGDQGRPGRELQPRDHTGLHRHGAGERGWLDHGRRSLNASPAI